MKNENKEQTEKIEAKEWIQQELNEIGGQFDGEKLPSFKPEENKIKEIEVDISEQWQKWIDRETGLVKKIIPVTHNKESKVFWLNVANPIYRGLLDLANDAANRNEKSFKAKVMRTGQKQNTRYALVD